MNASPEDETDQIETPPIEDDADDDDPPKP